MTVRRRKNLRLQSQEQQAMLTSPLRLEILEHFFLSPQSSVRELAERLERPADSLYYHVRKLVRAGLLLESGSRSAGRRQEALYEVAAETLEYPAHPGSESSRRHTLKALRSATRLSEREVEATLRRRRVPTEGPKRQLLVARMRARLRPKALSAVNRHLDAILQIAQREFDRSARRADAQSFSLMVVLAPSPREAERTSR